ncbi:MAG: hypothetical protein ACI4BH_00155 [Muribaculaceae bacterium]
MRKIFRKIRQLLSRLPFRTGVVVFSLCIPCYIFSFAQFALPGETESKIVLWALFFGLGQVFQYTGRIILGSDGLARLKRHFGRK